MLVKCFWGWSGGLTVTVGLRIGWPRCFGLRQKAWLTGTRPAAQAGGGWPNDLCKNNEPPFNRRAAFILWVGVKRIWACERAKSFGVCGLRGDLGGQLFF